MSPIVIQGIYKRMARFQKLINYFSPYTDTTYTVSSGNCPSLSCDISWLLFMLTAGPRDQFPRWRRSRRRLSARNSRCNVITDLDTSKRSTQKAYRTIGSWDVEDPTLSIQSAHSWRLDWQPYWPAAIYPPPPPEYLLVLIYIKYSVSTFKNILRSWASDT
jgi:hypothetical protein